MHHPPFPVKKVLGEKQKVLGWAKKKKVLGLVCAFFPQQLPVDKQVQGIFVFRLIFCNWRTIPKILIICHRAGPSQHYFVRGIPRSHSSG